MNIDEIFEEMIGDMDWAFSRVPSSIRDEGEKWYMAYISEKGDPSMEVYSKEAFKEALDKEIQEYNESISDTLDEGKIEKYEDIFNVADVEDIISDVLFKSEV